jgi:hypothetical protein
MRNSIIEEPPCAARSQFETTTLGGCAVEQPASNAVRAKASRPGRLRGLNIVMTTYSDLGMPFP